MNFYKSSPGQVYMITHLSGSQRDRQRLLALGFYEGKKIEVAHRFNQGFIALLDGRGIALSSDILHHIHVEPIELIKDM